MKDGGPAFPVTMQNDSDGFILDWYGQMMPPGTRRQWNGLSIRDYFAGQALAGIIAAHTGDAPLPDGLHAVNDAYEYADAMISEREKRA